MYFIFERPLILFILGSVYGYLIAHNIDILIVTICTFVVSMLFSLAQRN